MTVVAGWCSSPRAPLALSPALTTGFPIKKCAAAAALAAALFYLLRSGAEMANAALVLHDGGGADRGHGRPPRRDVPHARRCGDDRAGTGAGSAGASEFSELGGVAAN
jgi:hypothetical protein